MDTERNIHTFPIFLSFHLATLGRLCCGLGLGQEHINEIGALFTLEGTWHEIPTPARRKGFTQLMVLEVSARGWLASMWNTAWEGYREEQGCLVYGGPETKQGTSDREKRVRGQS